MQIKKKSTDDSYRTADVDVILSKVNMMDASIESAAAIKVLIIKFINILKFEFDDFPLNLKLTCLGQKLR